MATFIYASLCTLMLLKSVAADCPYQTCDCISSYISCARRRLTLIPALNSTHRSGFTFLDFSANLITAIHAGQLPSNLTEISFLENPIATIDDNAFAESWSTLEKLSFSSARITRIPNDLTRVSNLKSLRIFNARITDWNNDAMENIGQTLEELYLMDAGISTHPDWILYFSRLTQLIMDGCSISSLPDDALFKVADNLTHLSLANNSLTSVPQTIAQLRVLQVLVLQNNEISNVSALPDSDQLVTLSLHNNNISDANLLSSKLQRYNESLITLSLNNNQFTEFPNLDFLSQVGSLDFSHNRLSNPNSGSVPAFLISLHLHFNSLPSVPRFMSDLILLNDVFLPYNAIEEIYGTDFPSLAVNVDLEHNLIVTLTNTSFPENSTIIFLNLNSNPIVDISPNAFENLPALKELRMQNSRLTRLPLSFPTLTSLYFLDLTNSTGLICTCAEKSLETWVQSLYPANVVGNCGDTSIYTFFVTLSPACPSLDISTSVDSFVDLIV